ncbi:MAG: ABC transporter substrate-binding protein [Acidimicrobiales bacterium]
MSNKQSQLRRPRLRPGRRMAVGGSMAALASVATFAVGAGTPAASATRVPAAKKAVSSCSPNATKITFLAWVPGMDRLVKQYNSTQSKVCVTLDDVGAGNPEYVKLAEALKTGKGAPDTAEVEYDELPSFEVTHNTVDLAKYGANKYKNRFDPWAWQEVSQGSHVYAMPGDAGPMGFYYNAKQLAKYHITPPATWAQFSADAAKLHKADPKAYLTNFAATDLQWVLSLMSQDNAFPFTYTGGANVTIDFTGPKQMAFANYWQKMLSAHELNALTDVSAQSFAAMDKGIDASWLSSAWGPSYFAPDVKATLGDWRAAAMPQWKAGQDIAANWGGSSYPVFTTSKYPAQAAAFSEWLNGTSAAWKTEVTAPSSLFPTFKAEASSPSFADIEVPVSGKTHPNAVFAKAGVKAKAVSWPPFMTKALTLSGTTFAGVLNGKETLQSAFKTFQNQLVSYAKSEGFTVKS